MGELEGVEQAKGVASAKICKAFFSFGATGLTSPTDDPTDAGMQFADRQCQSVLPCSGCTFFAYPRPTPPKRIDAEWGCRWRETQPKF